MNLDILGVVGFESPRMGLVKMDEDRHNLTGIHVPSSLALSAVLDVWCHIGAKLIQKSSTAQNNSSKLIARYLLGWIEDVFCFSYLNSSWRYPLIQNSD